MTHYEHLFLKLSEECAEVQQRVSKLLQFGDEEREPGQGLSNGTRLRMELNDLLAVIDMLESERYIQLQTMSQLTDHFRDKQTKVIQYLRYSEEIGMVKG